MESRKKTIAIIGAGPAGLATAKALLDKGFIPTIFEAKSTIGGVYGPQGAAWPGMRSTFSKHTLYFNDLPWGENVPDFPTKEDIYNYLCRYAEQFKLLDYIRFNHSVSDFKVDQATETWELSITRADNVFHQRFDFVVIAVGKYRTPSFPLIPGFDKFMGEKLHSSHYPFHPSFNGKTVLVVGGANSAYAIAENAAETAKQVIHVARKARWVLPRYTADKIPHDVVANELPPLTTDEERYNYYKKHAHPKQNKLPAVKKQKPRAVIADSVLTKKTHVYTGTIDELSLDGFVLNKELASPIHSIIFCTGYLTPGKEFYERFLPLYLHTFSCDYPNLGVVGITGQGTGITNAEYHHDAIFPVIERQACLVSAAVAQALTLPELLERRLIRAKMAEPSDDRGLISMLDEVLNTINAPICRLPNHISFYRQTTTPPPKTPSPDTVSTNGNQKPNQ